MSTIQELLPHTVDVASFHEPHALTDALPPGGGVYAFLGPDDRIIQLASGQNLRRCIKHRLTRAHQTDQPTRRADLSAITHRIRWQTADSRFETTLAFYRIARILYPKTYRKLIAFGPAWFIHIDPRSRLPRFEVTSAVYRQPGKYLGPYPTRTETAGTVADLEDLFDLCRYHDILDKTPNGQACAYYEMGKCPAPCDGSIPPGKYYNTVERARRFAWETRQPQIREWHDQMNAAARELAFERAAMFKSRIERVTRPARPSHAWVRDAADFKYLVVQRAGGTSWIKPFFVTAGRIEVGPRIRIKAIEEYFGPWVRQLENQHRQGLGTTGLLERTEQVWLVSHFLFKQDAAPGCLLHGDQLDPPDRALERISATFAARTTAIKTAEALAKPGTGPSKTESTHTS